MRVEMMLAAIMSEVPGIVLRAIDTYQVWNAGYTRRTGVATLILRFSSTPDLNITH
jgi:hypothetical protein